MERNVLVANIVGSVIVTIGIILYTIGVAKDGELPFLGWKTTVGFIITAIGYIVALIIIGIP